MRILIFFSDLMMPLMIFSIVFYGILAKRNVYEDFLKGAEDGVKTVLGICPTLIGLMAAVGVLRASGLLELVGAFLGQWMSKINIPPEISTLSIVRLFSSSAAVSLLLDIFKKYGADSMAGIMGAIILSATESVFYCMSVYFGSVKIEKTKHTLLGALVASGAGVLVAILEVRGL